MSTIKAIAVVEDKKAAVTDVSRPELRDGFVLVKVKAVGVNPTDWKHVDYGIAKVGSRTGCDYAGVVEEVGAGVTSFEKGDRIAGVVYGG
jgi:NADPH:quinone reductase-like Zn-dependent oxidoreductase